MGFPDRIERIVELVHPPGQVRAALTTAGAGTRLTVVESGFAQLPADAYRTACDGSSEGWAKELAELAGYLDAA